MLSPPRAYIWNPVHWLGESRILEAKDSNPSHLVKICLLDFICTRRRTDFVLIKRQQIHLVREVRGPHHSVLLSRNVCSPSGMTFILEHISFCIHNYPSELRVTKKAARHNRQHVMTALLFIPGSPFDPRFTLAEWWLNTKNSSLASPHMQVFSFGSKNEVSNASTSACFSAAKVVLPWGSHPAARSFNSARTWMPYALFSACRNGFLRLQSLLSQVM